jgi:predicted ATP-grasp superfamily ATP-dependent carboligase
VLPAAVLLDPTDSGLTLARRLRARGVAVHVLTAPATAWVAASRGARAVVLPELRAEPAAWIDALRRLAGEHGPAVLLSGSDDATDLLATRRAEIPDALRSFERAGGAHLRLMDKGSLHAIAQEAGVRVPVTRAIATPQDADDVARVVPFPAVLKPARRHRAMGRRMFTTPVDDPDQLHRIVDSRVEEAGPLLLSERVPGADTRLEGVVLVRDGEGRFPLVYVRRKLRQWPLGYGVGTLVECIDAPDSVEVAKRLVEHVGFVGLVSVELKRHADTGELVLIEANVRAPQNFSLGDAAGIDAAWRLYATLAGLELADQPAPRYGAKAMIPPLEARAVVTLVRRGHERPADLVRSWRGVRDFGVLDPRDPGPALARLGARLARYVPGGRSS